MIHKATEGVVRLPVHLAFYMHDLSGGGVERMRLLLISELQDQVDKITLIVQNARGELRSEVPAGTQVVELGAATTMAAIIPLGLFIRRVRPDILISSLDHNNIAALAAKIVAGTTGTKVVICQHNALSAEMLVNWKYRLVPVLYRLLARAADGIVAVSAGVADDLALTTGLRAERITTIYNPVIGRSFSAGRSGEVPHPWFHKRVGPVFVFAGRLVAQKDPETLILGFALRLCHGPARLIILGDGPLRETVKALAIARGVADHVCFAGFQIDPLPFLRAADGVVLTSRYEGLGNVLIEALGCGTPVIATNCPFGPFEILGGGQFGILIPVADPVALCEAMRTDLRARWPTETLLRRAAVFTAAACAERHLALIDRSTRQNPAMEITLFGLRISRASAKLVARLILAPAPAMPMRKTTRLIATPNLDHLRLLRNPRFRVAYHSAELLCVDGFPLQLYARARGIRGMPRVTGCELFHEVASAVVGSAHRLFFLVENELVRSAVTVWASNHGMASAVTAITAPAKLYADPVQQKVLARKISDFAATILVVTLGAPVSEIFVHENRDALPPCWALCVGQAVRIELGLTRRAPRLLRGLGLEWLWRIAREPTRLGGRYIRDALWFPWAVTSDLMPKKR